MGIIRALLSSQPMLKHKLRQAHIHTDPEEYVKRAFTSAIYMGIGTMLFLFFIFSRGDMPIFVPLIGGLVSGLFIYRVLVNKVDVSIKKREKEIDKEVLFAGRFLLVKLSSGKPLIGALVEASNTYGVASKYFREIVQDIDMGTPLEKALERATEFTPSRRFKKILFQITNALKIGVDVTNFLEAILDEIADEQLIEIKRYGKKLSSLTMFYMLLAIIMPSLGMTLFVVVASMVSIQLNLIAFSIINFGLLLIQLVFISLFKAARPNMNI